jgi:choline monooxygenase
MATSSLHSISNVNPFELKAAAEQAPPGPQLSVECYTDAQYYALEQQYIFAASGQYLGHQLMVPNIGDFYTLDWMQQAKVLVHNDQGIQLLSNICRHRQAIMLQGQGHTSHIVCPLHRWTYNTQGELLGAPHFAQKPCLNLQQQSLQQWQGLLFDSKRNIAQELKQLGCKQHFDFTDYTLDKVHIQEYAFNWKTFIEVYLEDYHVSPFHPGLAGFVDCQQLAWEFGENYSVQTVGVKSGLQKSGSPVYQHWQQQVLQYGAQNNKPQPDYGAIWMLFYPNLMLEWYPNVLVVSHIIPRGVDACTNVVEFYYPEDIALFEREYIAAQQAAYTETALEDQEICQRMHDGRRALASLKLDEYGPYQHPMETGLEHFHLWLRKQMPAGSVQP